METERINIVLALDRNYVFPAAVSIYSLVKHTEHAAFITFFILDIDVGEEGLQVLKHTAKPAELRVLKGFDSSIFSNATSKLPPSSWAKLWVIRLLPIDIDRAIYLDCDILVRGEIKLLWDTSLGSSLIGAVVDFGHPHGHPDLDELLQQHPDTVSSIARTGEKWYYNAGVLVLNLRRLRFERAHIEMPNMAARYEHLLPHMDQDVLNLWLWGHGGGAVCSLSYRWNAQGLGSYARFRIPELFSSEHELVELTTSADIVHFTGRVHPK